jgi:2,5-diketo-D-gluconate reductase B
MPDDLSIGLGTYENTDPETCANAVEHALEAGYRHVDTAEGYDNEQAVGEGIARSSVDREDAFLATKVSPDNLAHDDVIAHARASMDRLGVDYLDLLYVHWPIRAYDPEGTLSALDELHAEGLVRNVGLSNFRPDQLETALDHLDAPLFAHQVECHVMLPQEELRAMAREHDHHLVAYSPLAKGAVTEVAVLQEIAADHDVPQPSGSEASEGASRSRAPTAAQVALAWLAARESVVPIPKAASEAHIEENLAAMDLELTDEEVARVDGVEERRRTVDFEEAPWNR